MLERNPEGRGGPAATAAALIPLPAPNLRDCFAAAPLLPPSAFVNECVMAELKRIIEDSEVMKEDDSNWPEPDRVGRQELEVVLGDEHISFCVRHQRMHCWLVDMGASDGVDATCIVCRRRKLEAC